VPAVTATDGLSADEPVKVTVMLLASPMDSEPLALVLAAEARVIATSASR
jgi:hypothetical protein